MVLAGLHIHKEYTTPLLTAHIGDLSIFPIPFQVAILRVKGQLDRFNQHVEFVQKRHDMTFDVSSANRHNVLSDLKKGYEQLASIAKRIADSIPNIAGR